MSCPHCGQEHDGAKCPTNLERLKKAVDPRTRPVQLTLEEACSQMSNAVYASTALFEQLEGAGLIFGNGHHARQLVAQFAVKEIRERWNKSEDKGS